MVALKHDSLVWRLLLLVGGALALTALLVFLIVDARVGSVLRARSIEVYGQRAEAIVRELDHQAARLDLTGQAEAYRADFQDSAVRHFTEIHYRQAGATVFPFLLDGHGSVLAHPWFRRGDATYADDLAGLQASQDPGRIIRFLGPDGDLYVGVVRVQKDWDWSVVYAVPDELLTVETRQIETRMLAAWAVATILVLTLLAWLLIREIRPLITLADAAAAMARGDLDRGVDEERPGEVGVLARSFVHMRGAIRRQLAELRESESRYRKIFDAGADGLLLLDQIGNIVAANPAAAAIYGWKPEQLQGLPISRLLREDDVELAQALCTPPADKPVHLDGITCNREGQELATEISAVRLSFQGQNHAMVILRDVTAQRQLERQLLQSQKLESVGRLAGGIAHDFNNLLTPVLGYSEMLLDGEELSAAAREDVASIQRAGERARSLARQLLAFSRRQVMEMRALDLGDILDDFAPILRRTLREDIELVIDGDDERHPIKGDDSQIEQIIMNLVVNALDAMPDGGRVEITTGTRCLTNDDRAGTSLVPGPYASLTVRDTGPGIPPPIRDRVFEPFFTTKEIGKGTGLGLATIHGIVNQHDGWVGLRDHPEGGCMIEVLLPCLPDAAIVAEEADPGDGLPWRRGHDDLIWLVEDDGMVRELVENVLTRHGYRVVSFPSGNTCLAACDAGAPAPALLLTDVVMPGLNGPELRNALMVRGYSVLTLFMSGYAGETLVRRGLEDLHADFINKPINPPRLLRKIRRMLDAAQEARG